MAIISLLDPFTGALTGNELLVIVARGTTYKLPLSALAIGQGEDGEPDAFSFVDVTGVDLSAQQTSNLITVAGLGTDVSVAVSVVGGTYSKNGGAYTASEGTAQNGDTFRVRHSSSASYETAVNTTLTIGGISDTFTTTTLADPGDVTAPTITSSNPSGSYNEGVAISGTLTANESVSWSKSGTDAGALTLNSSTGAWSLETTDYETKTSYSWTFTATDGASNATNQVVSISITDVDEAAPVPYAPSGTHWDHRNLPAGAVASWDSTDGLQTLAQGTSGNQPAKDADGVDFDGSADILFDANRRPSHIATHILGDDVTCTGITRAPDKTWWIVGHPVGQAYTNVRLFHYSSDLLTRMGYTEVAVTGAQGACYDTDDDTIWLGCGSDGVLNVDPNDGTINSAILPTDTGMTWAEVRGVAIDQANGHLIIMEGGTGNVIQTVNKTTKAVIASGTLTESEKDHLFFDPVSRGLILTAGANNTNGNVILLNMDGPSYLSEIARFNLPEVQAIEGLYYADGKLWVCDDQHYHGGPSDENAVQEYDCGTIMGSKIAFCGALSYSSVTPTDALFVIGDPVGGAGCGVYVSSTTELNLRCAGGGASSSIRIKGLPSFTSPRTLYALFDTLNDEVRLWVDGVEYTNISASSGSIADIAGPLTDRQRLNMGAAYEGGVGRFLPATVKALGYRVLNAGDTDNRQKDEGKLAHDHGLTANLPSGHPYKSEAP